MKKFFAVMIVLVLCCTALFACQSATHNGATSSTASRPDDTKHPDNIDPTLALKLRKDYREFLIRIHGRADGWKLDEIWVQKYFGNYSGQEVVYMGSPLIHNSLMRTVEIANYKINFSSSQEVYVYNDSQFYTLKEAFEKKLIDKIDVYEIGKQLSTRFTEENPNP